MSCRLIFHRSSMLCLFGAIFVAVVSAVANAEEKGVRILDAVGAAIEQNPQVLLSEQDFEIARGRTVQESGAFDLQTGASAKAGKEHQLFNSIESETAGTSNTRISSSGFGVELEQLIRTGQRARLTAGVERLENSLLHPTTPTSGVVSFSLTQPLLRGRGRGATAAEEHRAQLLEESSHHVLRRTILEQAGVTARAYWNYRAAQESLEIFRDAEERAKQRHEDMLKLVEGGELPRSVLEQSQADYARRTADRINAELSLFSSKQELGLRMGVSYDQIAVLGVPADEFPELGKALPPIQLLPAPLAERIFETRDDLRAAELRLEGAQTLLELARNGTLPQLDLELSVGYRSLDEGDRTSAYAGALTDRIEGADVRAGLTYRFPVPNRAARGLYAQAMAGLRQARIVRDQLLRSIQSAVAVAISNLNGSLSTYRKSEEAKNAFGQALQNEMKKFRLQMATLLDVQQVEDQYTQALLQHVAAAQAYANAIVDLHIESGTLVSFEDGTGAIRAESFETLPEYFREYQ